MWAKKQFRILLAGFVILALMLLYLMQLPPVVK